ncbi:unnamed protein product [Phyllotreta striolata]|uniref:Uncharacterized protein n=1 Tax=Phyllotreta striolata TaxID=444603 RepID=A0A9N9THH3_PHYSR|nr:unnamed protein product [Phyllotreta striolata]
MIAKVLLTTLVVVLVAVNAEGDQPISNIYAEKLLQALQPKPQNGQDPAEATKPLLNWLNQLIESIKNQNPPTQTKVQLPQNLDVPSIMSKFSRSLDQPTALQDRALLNIKTSTQLNEIVKQVIEFFLVHYEEIVGAWLLSPVRTLADLAVNWLLPCGLQCTYLAEDTGTY